jgi:uncharacterized protein with GYD domain
LQSKEAAVAGLTTVAASKPMSMDRNMVGSPGVRGSYFKAAGLTRFSQQKRPVCASSMQRRQGRFAVAYFLIQVAYSQASAKAMIDHPQPREDVIRKTCESLGGKLHSFFFAFGEYDAVVTVDLPDNRAAAALALAIGSTGSVSKYITTVLMTSAEAVEAMKGAQMVRYARPA